MRRREVKKSAKDDEILGVTPGGAVITEKVAEEMAEEIERDGLDLSNFKIVYVDYPGLEWIAEGPGVPCPLTYTELHELCGRAEEEGRSFNDALGEELKRRIDP
jgi:hypothetical protein